LLSGSEWAYDICRYAGTRDLKVLIDVGANIGQTALYMRQFFPNAAIHSVELASKTAGILRHNTRMYPNIHVHACALGRAPGRAGLKLHECSLVNSLRYTADPDDLATAVEEVEITTADIFCAQQGLHHIDVLKTDAQGFDLDVMHGAIGLFKARAITFVLTEIAFEETHRDAQTFQPMHDFLRGQGFHLCGIYDQWNCGSILDCCNALYFCPGAVETGSREQAS
jgi:FkbM family methyltransferase